MSWMELKELGGQFGRSVTFARTFRQNGAFCGMIEFSSADDADAALSKLDNRRVSGSNGRLRVTAGDLSGGKGGGKGNDGGYGRDRSNGRDRNSGRNDRDRRESPRRRSPSTRRQSRSPRRRSRSRSPARRRGEDEEIMTLFVKQLPPDAREDEVRDDLSRAAPVLRVMMMKRDPHVSAFVRFGSVRDAERALGDVRNGGLKVCGVEVTADMAKRNTST